MKRRYPLDDLLKRFLSRSIPDLCCLALVAIVDVSHIICMV